MTGVANSGTIANYDYILNGATKTFTFPSYTKTPACDYAVTYDMVVKNSSGSTVSNILTKQSTTVWKLATSVKSLVGTYTVEYAYRVSDSLGATSKNYKKLTFTLKLVDPCLTTTLDSGTMSAMSMSVLGTKQSQTMPHIKDSTSKTYGTTKNGFDYCG